MGRSLRPCLSQIALLSSLILKFPSTGAIMSGYPKEATLIPGLIKRCTASVCERLRAIFDVFQWEFCLNTRSNHRVSIRPTITVVTSLDERLVSQERADLLY